MKEDECVPKNGRDCIYNQEKPPTTISLDDVLKTDL